MNEIISKIEKQLSKKRRDANERDRNEEIRQAVEAETKRIYTEAKEMFDEQLQRALRRTEKRQPPELEKASPRHKQNIKNERRYSRDNELPVHLNDEMLISEEVDVLMQSDVGDDSNDVQDNESVRDYTDIVDYVPPPDEEEEDDDDDDDEEYELPKSRRQKGNKKPTQISETSYTVLESGDIALTTELVDIGEFPESEGNFG